MHCEIKKHKMTIKYSFLFACVFSGLCITLEAFTAVQPTNSRSRLTPVQQQQRHRLPIPSGYRDDGTNIHTSTTLYAFPGLGKIELAGLLYDSTSTAFDAWEWTACLGAPAALVAGAVLVTLSETREDMAPRKTDKKWTRIAKQVTRFLLMSSFALEVVSIFVSTVTGTVLLSHGEVAAAGATVGYASPLGLLHNHHEFEYLTITVAFLQGLFHWLAAAALEIIIPKPGEGLSSKRMNKCLASCLATLCFWILAFYNHHLTFYGDYFGMVRRVLCLFTKSFLLNWPPRFMAFFYVPSFCMSLWFAWKAFSTPPEFDNE